MIGLLLGLWLAVDDPLGPVDQAPDGARDLACDLTASDALCSPPVRDEPPIDFQPPPNLGSGGGFAGGLGLVLVIVLVAVLVAVIAWIVIVALRNRSALDDDEVDDLDELLDDDVVGERIVDTERPPDRWRRAAAEHRAAGRFRDSVRCEYRALVGELARAGRVDEIPGRTSGEERRQVWALAPDVAPSFDLAADIFDAAWFDDDVVTADDDRRFVDAASTVTASTLAGRS